MYFETAHKKNGSKEKGSKESSKEEGCKEGSKEDCKA